MANGYMFLAELEKYLGQSEDPNRPNRSGGPVVDACQIASGYSPPGVPWCGCLQKYAAMNIKYQSYIDICDGYTGYIYDRAKARGWVKPGGASTPPGSLFIISGKHVGAVLSSGADYFTTIEGNAADACRSQTRAWSDGWVAIVPPDLGTTANGTRNVFGFEDLNTKPQRFGGWKVKSGRDAKMAAFKSSHPGWWVRPIKIATQSPYAFEAGKPGTFGKTWNYGPWENKETRDSKLDGWKRLNHGNVRTYAKTVNGGGPTGGSSGIGNVN
jgi:hypothetical protein